MPDGARSGSRRGSICICTIKLRAACVINRRITCLYTPQSCRRTDSSISQCSVVAQPALPWSGAPPVCVIDFGTPDHPSVCRSLRIRSLAAQEAFPWTTAILTLHRRQHKQELTSTLRSLAMLEGPSFRRHQRMTGWCKGHAVCTMWWARAPHASAPCWDAVSSALQTMATSRVCALRFFHIS